MKKLFLLLMAVVAFSLTMSAQNRTVSGQVLYEGDDEPLAGASIIPQGQTRGVVTDIDGNFTIQVAPSVTYLNISLRGNDSPESQHSS
ncbi:MAG: carboxypeptidase-like regulatory domain-containing protein [Bacteroidales bacterium]|nr:carboxypeptidase-like regulatory domain-containing protein [Bacteroidales bacterium]